MLEVGGHGYNHRHSVTIHEIPMVASVCIKMLVQQRLNFPHKVSLIAMGRKTLKLLSA